MPSLSDAFDLRPLGEITLGGRSYPVPPLTFGRFQRVLGLDMAKLVASVPTAAPSALADAAKIVVPDLDEQDWRDFAKEPDVAHLFMLFVRGHDWEYIGKSIRFGEPQQAGEVPSSREAVMAGLLSLSEQSGVAVDELLEKRVEGFYLITDGVKERNERARAKAEEPPSTSHIPPVGLGVREDGGAGLLSLMERADG